MDVFVLMGERQSCEDEGDQMDVFVLMGERQSCEEGMTRWMCLC